MSNDQRLRDRVTELKAMLFERDEQIELIQEQLWDFWSMEDRLVGLVAYAKLTGTLITAEALLDVMNGKPAHYVFADLQVAS